MHNTNKYISYPQFSLCRSDSVSIFHYLDLIVSFILNHNIMYAKYTMVSRRRLVAFILVISSVVLLAVFDGLLGSLSLFVVRIFLKLLAVFVGRHRSFSLFLLVVFSLFLSPSRKLLAILLAVFSLLLSAISEAFRRQSWKLFVVFVGRLGSFSLFSSAVLEAFCCFCRPSWKLLADLVGCLGSFSLPFLLFCSQPFSCCFRLAVVLLFLAVLLAVLVACSSRCFSSLIFSSFLAKTFSGFPFLIEALVNIQSSASSKRTVKRNVYSTLIVQSQYG